jgi:hypothetical protein
MVASKALPPEISLEAGPLPRLASVFFFRRSRPEPVPCFEDPPDRGKA